MPLIHHSAFGSAPVRYDLIELPDDPDAQVEATIALMRKYILEDAFSPEIQGDIAMAYGLYPDVAPHEAIFRFIKDRVQFAEDVHTASPVASLTGASIIETLIRPRDLSRMTTLGGKQRGDCDDFSMYGASMLVGAGAPTGNVKLVTVAADVMAPRQFSHVYNALYVNGVRIPLDISHGPYPGWETENQYRIQEWAVTDGLGIMIALGVAAWAFWSRRN